MLDSADVARVAICRLKVPVGAHKLAVVTDIARSLVDPNHGKAVADALLEWIEGLSLESEIVEALAPIVIAGPCESVEATRVYSAIRCPSLLSRVYLDLVFGRGTDLTGRALTHSGPLPAFYSGDATKARLRAGGAVPGILWSNFNRLERDTGLEFTSHWAYEYDRLSESNPSISDGQLGFYLDSDRDQSSASFASPLGHLARSAFLRTLAFAMEAWDMPVFMAWETAGLASPFDPFYLRMPPEGAPSWAIVGSCLDGGEALNQMDSALKVSRPGECLLQFSGPICRDSRLAVDLDVHTLLLDASDHDMGLDLERIFDRLDFNRLAKWAPRRPDGSIAVRPTSEQLFGEQNGVPLKEALFTTFGASLGYMHSELLHRTPYVPANYSDDLVLVTKPRTGGADLEIDGTPIGQICIWNVEWRPFYPKFLGPSSACSLTVSQATLPSLLSTTISNVKRVWRLKAVRRDSDYGQWTEESSYGFAGVD